MIECSSCHTLNPDAERTCLSCGAALARLHTGASTVGTARCPAGHPIDPSWKSCPYCDRTQTASGAGAQPQRSTRLDAEPPAGPQRTRLESSLPGGDRRTRLDGEPPWQELVPPPPRLQPTRLESPDERPAGRQTVLQEDPPAVAPSAFAAPPPPELYPLSPPPPPSGGNAPIRRLLGVLAAPNLGPGGSVFPVRGGKNTIGASRVNDVILTGDSEVSGEHAVILHRNGTFHLADRLSTNGTWVNGGEVPANGTVPLHDRDRIRCGRTELVFLIIENAEGSLAGMESD